MRPKLSFANVMSVLAVFIALGGTSYAVARINGSTLVDRSVAGKKLKRDSVGGREVRESRLRAVPEARRIDSEAIRVREQQVAVPAGSSRELTVPCAGTVLHGGAYWSPQAGDEERLSIVHAASQTESEREPSSRGEGPFDLPRPVAFVVRGRNETGGQRALVARVFCMR